MKIVLLSDTHYGNNAWDPNVELSDGPFSKKDHKNFAMRIHEEKPDVLIVAGDVADTNIGIELLKKFFDIYKNPYGDSLFITGNHDVWCHRGMLDAEEKYAWHASEAEKNGWIFLNDEPWEKDEFYIAGNMGWYDFSSSPIELGITPEMYENKRNWSDYNQMRFADKGPGGKWLIDNPTSKFCANRLGELDQALAKVPKDPKDRKGLIIVTHIVGFKQCLGPINDYYTAFFGNLSIGKRVLKYRPDLYYCGHTHYRAEGTINGVKYINNGSGYGRGSKRFDVLEFNK